MVNRSQPRVAHSPQQSSGTNTTLNACKTKPVAGVCHSGYSSVAIYVSGSVKAECSARLKEEHRYANSLRQ